MTSSTSTASPLRQRMIEDMRMRELAPKTRTAYIRAVRQLAAFLKRSPDTATEAQSDCAGPMSSIQADSPPSGAQHEIRHGSHRAIVTEVGANITSITPVRRSEAMQELVR